MDLFPHSERKGGLPRSPGAPRDHGSQSPAVPLAPSQADWIAYWNHESHCRPSNWARNMELFVRASDPYVQYGPDETVLDIGCGPGYLAAFLKDRVRAIHGVDTSERYIRECRERFAGVPHLQFHTLGPDYLDFSMLEGQRFSIIICLSVIQYYRDVREVERLIDAARQLARPGARMLIADIPVARNPLIDVVGFLRTGFREGCLWENVRFLARLQWSRRGRELPRLLVLPERSLRTMMGRLTLDARVLSERMTLNANRKHMLIRL